MWLETNLVILKYIQSYACPILLSQGSQNSRDYFGVLKNTRVYLGLGAACFLGLEASQDSPRGIPG